MLSQKFVFPRSKNFTSDVRVRTTPAVPIDPGEPRRDPDSGEPVYEHGVIVSSRVREPTKRSERIDPLLFHALPFGRSPALGTLVCSQ